MREHESTKTIFDKALQQAQSLSAARVKSVHVVIGEVADLDQDIIQEHWIELSRGTPLEHVQIHFRSIIAKVQCMACFKKYHPENGTIHCPNCGSFGAKILSGEEFYFESIETDDE
jgi:Zn finger protein HypA/HybF involved in hydrogenase expression